jgi:ribbon-helix-helix CopG family protein
MAIAKNPKRMTDVGDERQAEAFIAGAGKRTNGPEARLRKKPIMIRIGPDMIRRIDAAARRLGISRSAFIVSSAAEHLERME